MLHLECSKTNHLHDLVLTDAISDGVEHGCESSFSIFFRRVATKSALYSFNEFTFVHRKFIVLRNGCVKRFFFGNVR